MGEREKINLNGCDRAILPILQEDATIPTAEIAEKVGLSATPCWKRIKRLERKGLINHRGTILDRERLRLGGTVMIAFLTAQHGKNGLAVSPK